MIGLAIFHLSLLFFHEVDALPNHRKEIRFAHKHKHSKHGDTQTGIRREIRIGFAVCGKTDLLTKNATQEIPSIRGLDTNDLNSHTKSQPFKRGWGKDWLNKLHGCCRAHDLCTRIVPPRSEKHGFLNTLDYKIYDCDCDDNFSKCLKSANSFAADAVGDLYFNVLHIPCLSFESKASIAQADLVADKGHTWKETPSEALVHLYPESVQSPLQHKVKYTPVEPANVVHTHDKDVSDAIEHIPLRPTEETVAGEAVPGVSIVSHEETVSQKPAASKIFLKPHEETITVEPLPEKEASTPHVEKVTVHTVAEKVALKPDETPPEGDVLEHVTVKTHNEPLLMKTVTRKEPLETTVHVDPLVKEVAGSPKEDELIRKGGKPEVVEVSTNKEEPDNFETNEENEDPEWTKSEDKKITEKPHQDRGTLTPAGEKVIGKFEEETRDGKGERMKSMLKSEEEETNSIPVRSKAVSADHETKATIQPELEKSDIRQKQETQSIHSASLKSKALHTVDVSDSPATGSFDEATIENMSGILTKKTQEAKGPDSEDEDDTTVVPIKRHAKHYEKSLSS